MRILTVIPIARGIGRDTLTYFTKEDVPRGSIVVIPLRKKSAYGLVIASKRAEEMKSEIKTLSYNIRKIDKLETHTFLSDIFIQSAEKIADYYAGSVGSVLSVLIPNKILENSDELSYKPRKIKEKVEDTAHSTIQKTESPLEIKSESIASASTTIFHETLLLQSNDEERYATYKSLIREEFAKNNSVFFCLPTTEDLLNARHTLEKGIEGFTFILHSGLTAKEIVAIWKQILAEPHSVLIIATGSFLCLPRDDVSTIIVEKESSRAYKMQSRPFVDIRMVAEIFAKQSNKKLVLGDTLLRTETLWEGKNGNYAELSPLKFRSLSTATCELVNMRLPAHMEQKDEKKRFAILGEQMVDMLVRGREHAEHTFLFCGRKGLYPITVCSDCGTTVTCTNCNAPVVLYGKRNENDTREDLQKNGKNLFVCHHCGERRDAHELCKHCGGWRLTPLGIGTEQVYEQITKLFPEATVILLDKEHITTHKQAVKARDQFYNTPGSIMVGTEMALTYLNSKIENTGVVSLDSFFSIPDFRIHEKVFHILLALRSLTDGRMFVQTRQKDTRLFDYALRGNLIDFYRDEIEERKQIGYPPFTTYIKVTLEGEKSAIKKQMQVTAESLKPYTLSVFDAFTPGRQAKHTMHGLIVLQKSEWVDPILLTKLRSLPPNHMIKIDPDTLL
ncbi:MAG: hypothetical protein V4473_00020 [Patescibacteria group bacterium]